MAKKKVFALQLYDRGLDEAERENLDEIQVWFDEFTESIDDVDEARYLLKKFADALPRNPKRGKKRAGRRHNRELDLMILAAGRSAPPGALEATIMTAVKAFPGGGTVTKAGAMARWRRADKKDQQIARWIANPLGEMDPSLERGLMPLLALEYARLSKESLADADRKRSAAGADLMRGVLSLA
jgi:hypothetical protein